jgi:RNA polymerase sigma-70 factor (ECF subfamily)
MTCGLEAALLACASGDRSGLRIIYEQEAPRLLAMARRIVGQPDLAEDVLQDALLQIWKNARSFDPGRGSARGWLYTVVRNRANKLRRAQLRDIAVDDRILLEIFDSAPRLLEECVLRRQIDALEQKKRASIILAYVDGCSHREIAEELKVPVGTAKAWIRRGLVELRSEIVEA